MPGRGVKTARRDSDSRTHPPWSPSLSLSLSLSHTDTHTHTERHTHRDTHTQRDTHRDTDTQRETHTHRERETHTHTQKETHTHTDTHTNNGILFSLKKGRKSCHLWQYGWNWRAFSDHSTIKLELKIIYQNKKITISKLKSMSKQPSDQTRTQNVVAEYLENNVSNTVLRFFGKG